MSNTLKFGLVYLAVGLFVAGLVRGEPTDNYDITKAFISALFWPIFPVVYVMVLIVALGAWVKEVLGL